MKKTFAVSLLLFGMVSFANGQVSRDEPLVTDEFSGRTIEAGPMAKHVILSRIKNSPRVGEKAPKFDLYSLDRKKRVSLETLHQEKPVVLIFSSWTCGVFLESAYGLAALSKKFEDEVDFVFVYIREVHPGEDVFDSVPDAENFSERVRTAIKFKAQTRLPFEILVDEHSDTTAVRWASWPLRVYAIDVDGKVIYSGAQGPWGYRPYEGFLHGDGIWDEMDEGFNKNSLEAFLAARFGEHGAPREDP